MDWFIPVNRLPATSTSVTRFPVVPLPDPLTRLMPRRLFVNVLWTMRVEEMTLLPAPP